MRGFSSGFVSAARSAGWPAAAGAAVVQFMELQHTCITWLHEPRVDAITIAGVTGHSPVSVQAVIDRHHLIRTRKAVVRAFEARLEAKGRG